MPLPGWPPPSSQGCGDGVESTADPGTTEQPCGDGAVAGDASDPVMVGEGFRTEGFEAKVTDVELGVTSIPRQGSPLRPKYGQFVVVTVEAENVGKEPDV